MIGFLYFSSKSIFRLKVEGLIDMNLLPSEYSISFLILIILIGSLLTSIPAEIIFSININLI